MLPALGRMRTLGRRSSARRSSVVVPHPGTVANWQRGMRAAASRKMADALHGAGIDHDDAGRGRSSRKSGTGLGRRSGGWMTAAAAAQGSRRCIRPCDGRWRRCRPIAQPVPPRRDRDSSSRGRMGRTGECARGRRRGPGALWWASRSSAWLRSSEETRTQSGCQSAISRRSRSDASGGIGDGEDREAGVWRIGSAFV